MKENDEIFVETKELLVNVLQQDKLLVDAMHLLPYMHMVPQSMLKKLKTTTYYEKIYCNNENLFSYLLKVLSAHLIGDNGVDTFIAMMYTGTWNLNPAYIALRCIDREVYIVAMAKEGLINQNTAQKAVNMIKNTIREES